MARFEQFSAEIGNRTRLRADYFQPLDGAAEVLGDFATLGQWLADGGSWTQLSGVNPENMLAVDLDGDNADEIAADYGGLGVWLWNAGSWSQISGLNPE